MKQVYLCSRTDKSTSQKDGLQPPYITDRVTKASCSTAFGKIPSWWNLRISGWHTDFSGWQICLWGEIFNSLSSFVQQGQRENKVRVENWGGHYFSPRAPQLFGDLWGIHHGGFKSRGAGARKFPGFRIIPYIEFSMLPWCLAVIWTCSSSWQPFGVGWNDQKWFVPRANGTRTLPWLAFCCLWLSSIC